MDLIVIALFVGCGLTIFAVNWMDHRKTVARNMMKPVKPLTPELIHHRVVKAQWRKLLSRLRHLTTQKEVPSSFPSELSKARVTRDCVGVLSLGVSDNTRYADQQQIHQQPMPLCAENRQKLIELGFTRFSDDGLWVFYVEPQ